MKPTRTLHDLGQSLWLDNISRELLNSGTLLRYIDELSVTGLTSNPTIFDHAIKNSATYDGDISRKASSAKSEEGLVFKLALADLTRAAELFQPAIEAAIFAGVPVNVTLLFWREQYVAAAEAHLRGVERRIEAGRSLSRPPPHL